MRTSLSALTLAAALLVGGGAGSLAEPTSPARKVMPLHPTPWSVDGEPVLGTYTGGKDPLDDLKRIQAVGMNVVLGHEEELDPSTPAGAFCREHGLKVMHHLTKHLYHGVRLRDAVTADQTTIPLHFAGGRREFDSNLIQIDDEWIRYASISDAGLVDCERGVHGTRPAEHREGTILFWPELCEQDIRKVKDSPNLFGYYTLDDSPGDAKSALKGIYQAVQRVDPGKKHPVCAGFGDAGSLINFGPEVCDILMIYWYPVGSRSYERERTSQEVQRMLTAARSRLSGVPFIGVYQAFDGRPLQTGQGVPTPEQLREQLEDFVREGASGLVAYHARGSGLPGWADLPDLEAVLRTAHLEIAETGGLSISPETDSMREARIQPEGFWDTPREVPGVVPAWRLIGPFADDAGELLDAEFPPEDGIDLKSVLPVRFGSAAWRTHPTTCGAIGFTNIYGDQNSLRNSVVYAFCEVTVPAAQDVLFQLGTDDDAWVRVNGTEIYRHEGPRGLNYNQASAAVHLPSGTSTILVKVYNREGMWGLYLKITDAGGRPVAGLSFSPSAP